MTVWRPQSLGRAIVPAIVSTALAGCLAVLGKAPRDLVVETGTGPVRGMMANEAQSVTAFLGVPFAAPPAGANRWAPPQPVDPWSAPRNASTFAPACMQGDYIIAWYGDMVERFGGHRRVGPRPNGESEDCLYLNVWTPASPSSEPRPVMVWIHGGGYLGGWSYEPDYRGTRLAEKNVIVVSIAYRLGAFGYIGPETTEGNFGLLDQLAALHWVQDNISAFGGDPENVTLFGESAGAASMGTLMVSPQADGLFHRAIHQSGGFEFVSDTTLGEAHAAFERLRTALAPILPKEASASDILSASNKSLPGHDFGPVARGAALPDEPGVMMNKADLGETDLLIGTNLHEWRTYIDPDKTAPDLQAWRTELGANAVLVDQLVDELGEIDALDRLETARMMRCPGRQLARAAVKDGAQVYMYRFDRVRPGREAAETGSYHGAEIPYVFDTHADWLPTDQIDRRLTDLMMDAWVSFARNGEPALPGDMVWPSFGEQETILVIGDVVEAREPFDLALCDALAGAGTEMTE